MKQKKWTLVAGILVVLLACVPVCTAEEGENLAENGGFDTIAENSELPDDWTYEAWDEDPAMGYAMLSEDDG